MRLTQGNYLQRSGRPGHGLQPAFMACVVSTVRLTGIHTRFRGGPKVRAREFFRAAALARQQAALSGTRLSVSTGRPSPGTSADIPSARRRRPAGRCNLSGSRYSTASRAVSQTYFAHAAAPVAPRRTDAPQEELRNECPWFHGAAMKTGGNVQRDHRRKATP
jgi:hypothetical protein